MLRGDWFAVWTRLSGSLFNPSLREKGFVMRNLFSFVGIASMAVCCMVFGATEVFANPAANDVTFTPIVNFGDLFTTLTSVLAPIVVGALTLGLAIWGARYVFGIIRSMGR